MFYTKNNDKELKKATFKNPSSEYRAAPFWAWNCKLEKDTLTEQIDYFKEMGFGGFNIHPRIGMATRYLGDEYMQLVKDCVKKASDNGMYAWLYDEDRWPSGFAGGFVTSDPEYRQRMLVLTQKEEICCDYDEAVKTGKPYLFACYDIKLTPEGKLDEYRQITCDDKPVGCKWYAYVKTPEPTANYNYQTYVDTMNKKAIDRFIEITHEKYRQAVGEYFGSVVPAIFTDEPNHVFIKPLSYALSDDEAILAWTMDFDVTFKETYGYDISESLPGLLWERADGRLQKVRYDYYNHVADRFAEAYTDNLGKWCDEHGIILTGHMITEENLRLQTYRSGEVMRNYRGLGIPGVDILMDKIEFNTLKQCQSAVHQYGREGMLSELYGVTNWDFDFRGHKFQGDWQAALGVTCRMHHLSWVSMEGPAKRDYPASINYQSPWYREYNYVEDHYARLNTALTRGKPKCRVGVIHPMESFWMYCGCNEHTQLMREYLDERFKNLTDWLLYNLIDFEFISEALLPELANSRDGKMYVGEMHYDAVIVPSLTTIRSSTLDFLKKMSDSGDRVIFAGDIPHLVNALESDKASEFATECEQIDFSMMSILESLEENRFVDIKTKTGARTANLIYSLRQDGEDMWLFIAHAKKGGSYPNIVDVPQRTDVNICIYGEYQPVLYDTITGDIREIGFEIKDGRTIVPYSIYQLDSILLKLTKPRVKKLSVPGDGFCGKVIRISPYAEVVREENNVLLLDRARYSLDDGDLFDEEDVLKLYDSVRKILGYKPDTAQPWAKAVSESKHSLKLEFDVYSDISFEGALLGIENPDKLEILFNGEKISGEICGYFVDKSIKTLKLPEIKKGRNTLSFTMPFGNETFVEACYILGDFDVELAGRIARIKEKSQTYGYGDVTSQGMPFYGGNLIYKTEFNVDNGGKLRICAYHYRGAVMRVSLDGEEVGIIAYAPYTLVKEDVTCGKHELEIKVYGSRVNTFGPVHSLSQSPWYGPEYWRTSGCEWSYEYSNLRKTGLLSAPVLEIED